LVANGTKRHFAATQQTVAFGSKADIEIAKRGPARSACAAMMALHRSGVVFRRPWQPPRLEP
jgi:hypothetical protein